MNAGEKIPRVSRIAPFVERLRDFSTGVSLVGFYLAGIGAFIFAVAYLKGVQVLMFIPALFLSMLLHSFYETWSIGRRTKFTLEKSKDGYLIDVRSDLRSNLSFRIGFKDATGKVVFADPDSKTLSILRPGSGESEIFAYWHGSFDLFRRVARIGKIPRSSVA